MIIIALAFLGLILGSFVNAWVWRLHELQELPNTAKKTRREALSISKGRSMCPNCEHELAAKDLIPVLSWVLLRGQCRYCHKAISWQYPVVELLTAGLFVLSYTAWSFLFHGIGLFQYVLFLGFIVVFMALAVYDLRWYLLPDKIVFPLIVIAAAETITTAVWLHSSRALWEPAIAVCVIFGLFYTLFQISKGRWIGGGDVKLAVVLGLLAATPLHSFLVIFIASLLGTATSVPVLMQGKKGLKVHIPFGPYLLAATIIVVLYGSDIADWYQRLLLG